MRISDWSSDVCSSDLGAAELDLAVAAARKAYPSWRATPLAERRALLIKAAERIEQNAKELGALFTREQGRPIAFAKQEIYGAAYWLRAMAAIDLPVEIAEDSETRRIEEMGRAAGRERGCQYGWISVVAV